MPAPKNTFLRYRIINRCLASKSKQYWSQSDLVNKLGQYDIIVSERTLKYDLEAMRHEERLGFNAPIAYCKINKGYYYTKAGYSIDTIPLSDEELNALSFAMATLKQYKGLHLVSEFEGAMDKIVKVVDEMAIKNPSQNQTYIEFEKAPYSKGIEFLDPLLTAIREKQVLEVNYTKFDTQLPKNYLLHPYVLKEYKNRWYVLGLSEEKKGIVTLGLDRINQLKVQDKKYIQNKLLNTTEYFQHTLGITHATGPVEDIILHCAPSLAPYIKTQYLHHSQEVLEESDKGLTVRLKLIPNYELISLILSYVPHMQVISPLSLKEQVKERLLQALGS